MGGRKARARPQDRVDRAVAGVRRAVGQLVASLGDEDLALVEKAVLALVEVGPFAVGPLANALPRAASPVHRAAIVGLLKILGAKDPAPVMKALVGTMRRDPDERVRTLAASALSGLIMAETGRIGMTASSTFGRPGVEDLP